MSEKLQMKKKVKEKIKEPERYKVVMYNDDFTPMDFVVSILIDVFHKTEADAMGIMLRIHQGTKETIGEYSYDIARTKVDICTRRARNEGYPFLVKVEQ
ncbi:MAG: ATP-dependent Clp protease adaptor ClpS [Lachnospiraceae bacterium]|nr:ATP-dependent Clp protease adaptor ClpS [Lachnospiraceae bacterium]